MKSFDIGDLRFNSCPKCDPHGNREAVDSLGKFEDRKVCSVDELSAGVIPICGGGDGPNEGGSGRSCAAAADTTSYPGEYQMHH